MSQPLVGIVVDNRENTAKSGRYEVSIAYSRCVAQANGIPLLLPHEPDLAEHYARMCDALVLTGGVDPNTEHFGEPMHPKARPMDPTRQAFDMALLDAAKQLADMPVLGVRLGMQLMALQSGGCLDQYLPDNLPSASIHEAEHTIQLTVRQSAMIADEKRAMVDQRVVSSHRQAVNDSGSMRIVAKSPDGVIEAIDDPALHFYVGVQWHPERGDDGPLGAGLFERLVSSCNQGRA